MGEKQYFYHIITFGCQMNKSDSERIETVLQKMGLVESKKPEDANVIILNTCSVRKSAEDRVFGMCRNFSKIKAKNSDLIICVTGCMPGRDENGQVGKKLRAVDLYFPIKDLIHLPQRLAEINPNLRSMEDLGKDYLALHPTYNRKFQAFVPIQTGCNQYCTYCVVPYARGKEINRSVDDILTEIRDLAKNGCLEITLLGQIVNHYIAPDPETFSPKNPYTENDFARLLWEVNQISGIERIHWTGPHPVYMNDEVIDALTLPKQINFLHLPIQSGNNEILEKMNRKHTREFYLDLIKKIKAKKPEIAIGTDIIVGFCGETNEQFYDTVDLYKACDFDISYHAQYSTRSGTVADKNFADDVPKTEKKHRWQVLQDMMEEITLRKNQKYLGQTVSVLVDKFERGLCEGNSSEMKRMSFRGDETLLGKIVDVDVKKASTWMLYGTYR